MSHYHAVVWIDPGQNLVQMLGVVVTKLDDLAVHETATVENRGMIFFIDTDGRVAIGERRDEGFGEVAICHQIHVELAY